MEDNKVEQNKISEQAIKEYEDQIHAHKLETIASRINKDSVVISISKKLILEIFEDNYSEYYKVKNKKKFFEAFAEQFIENMEMTDAIDEVNDHLTSNADTNDFIKELEDED